MEQDSPWKEILEDLFEQILQAQSVGDVEKTLDEIESRLSTAGTSEAIIG